MMKPYYKDDYVTIYNADCREVLPELEKVDLVLTDPPYGVGASTDKSEYIGSHFVDDESFIRDVVVGEVLPMCRSISPMVVLTCGIKCMWLYPKPDSFGVFYYPAAVGWQSWGSADTNPILYYGKCKKKGALSWSSGAVAPENGHPCAKPIKQWRKLVTRFADKESLVLDPFMGSGTTLHACKDLGIKAIGIEMEEKYCEIAVKRLRQEYLDLGV